MITTGESSFLRMAVEAVGPCYSDPILNTRVDLFFTVYLRSGKEVRVYQSVTDLPADSDSEQIARDMLVSIRAQRAKFVADLAAPPKKR